MQKLSFDFIYEIYVLKYIINKHYQSSPVYLIILTSYYALYNIVSSGYSIRVENNFLCLDFVYVFL